MTLNDIIDINLLNRFLTNLRSLFATKSEVAAKPTGKIYYGTCSTTANTYIKEATVETFPLDEDDKPLVGTVVAIKYSVSNTYKTEGQTYALNVNNTGAYPMYYNNAAVATSTSANTLVAGYKNRHVFYVFNGTQWIWLSAGYDTNTTYSGMTQAEVDAGTGTTARLITPARLRDNFYTEGEVDTLLGSKANTNDLATVATSGSYSDLDDTPTIPSAVTESTVSGWGFTKNTGTYSKPSGGIPESDLADAVQTSLGKADTALQSFTESDPTVPSHVKGITTTDISNWNSKQAAIADLSDIRNGAALGATAVQTETDPVFNASAASGITLSNITSWNGKADKVAVVNHGTSDTTFALTPNILHIWGEVSSLILTLGGGSSGVLNEYMFRFTCPSAQAATINLPSTVKWVQTPSFEAGKTYEISIVNNLAGYLTDDMEGGGSSSGNSGIPIVNQTLTSIEIEPNCFNVWREVSSLTITLASPEDNTIVNEYMIQFTSGSTATNLSFTNTINWIQEVNIEANHIYQISIVNNIGVIGGVST